jgi:NAD(P)-dependent dehydrogenase (short-subunit alcohol dehydrogenase family)
MAKTYLITGTSRGIGLQLTEQLLKAGHKVLAVARQPQNSPALMALKDRGQLSVYAADVTSDEQVAALARDLKSTASIDTLINNAGIYGENLPFESLSWEKAMTTLATNAIAPMRVTRALLPWLKKSSSPKVVHITSLMGSIADNSGGGHYGYRMSKAALNMFNKSFAVDHPDITALVIHPGWVKTDMGGSQAPLEVRDSAAGILAVIAKTTIKDSGKFFDWQGKSLPW